jgi:tellurite resistance protein TehA-like permease
MSDAEVRATGPVRGVIAQAARATGPASFAMVMATGIVSAGMRQVGQAQLAGALLAVALAGFAVLIAVSAWRAATCPDLVRADLSTPDRAFTSFALVAAANLLAVRLQQDGHRSAALALAAVGLLAWLALSYVVPTVLAVRVPQRPVITDVNGTWYLWVVGTQSVAIAAASLRPEWLRPSGLTGYLAVIAWSAGAVLYLVVTAVVLARLLLAGIREDEPVAPYWISMGAASISVFAAARILQLTGSPLVAAVRPAITGLAVMFWAFATWLIPLLLVLGISRGLRGRARQRYHAGLWVIVFPLGMYGIAGLDLGAAADLRVIHDIGAMAVWPAAAAWGLTFIAMLAAPFREYGHRGSSAAL